MFIGRFGPGSGEVLFDRICRENGIRHLLTAPPSPTPTGKVERFHKTIRKDFLSGKTFESLEEAQDAIDVRVVDYNTERPQPGIAFLRLRKSYSLRDGTLPCQRSTEAAQRSILV